MKTPSLLLTSLALTLSGCASSQVRPTTGPEVVTWAAPGKGSHWSAQTARLGNRGEIVIAAGNHALLYDLATGRDLKSFVLGGGTDGAAPGANRPGRETERLTAIAPDGSLIAVAAGDHLTVFRRDSAEAITRTQLKAPLTQLAFTTDGARLLATTVTRIRVAEIEGSYDLLVVDARSGAVVSSQHFSLRETVHLPGETVVVESGSSSQPGRRFETRDLKGDLVWKWSFADVERAAFSSNGLRAAVLGRDGSLRIVEHGEGVGPGEERTLWSHQVERTPKALAFTGDGSRLLVYAESPNEVIRLDAATGESQGTRPCPWLEAPCFSPDGRWALDRSSVRPCALEPEPEGIASHGSDLYEISALTERAGRLLVTLSDDEEPTVAFDPKTGSRLPLPAHKLSPFTCCGCPIAVTATRELIRMDASQPNRAARISASDCVRLYGLEKERETRAVAVTSDCLMLYEASKDGAAGWGEGICLASPGTLDGPVVLSADSRWALAHESNDTLTLWDLEKRQLQQVLASPDGGETVIVALSEDGRWAFARSIGEQRETLIAWERGVPEPRWTHSLQDVAPEAVALRPDRRQLAAGTSDGKVLLVDGPEQPRQLIDLAASLDYPTALHWLADGNTLIFVTARGALLAIRL